MCIFPCLGYVIHCPCNIAPPNLEEQIKLIRGKKTSITAPGLVMYCTYQEWYLSHWVCLKTWVSHAHVAIIMSYVRRNVSDESCIDCFLNTNQLLSVMYFCQRGTKIHIKSQKSASFVELTFDSITLVIGQDTGEQLCLAVQQTLIHLSQTHTHTLSRSRRFTELWAGAADCFIA